MDLLKWAVSGFEVIHVLLGADDMKIVEALAKYVKGVPKNKKIHRVNYSYF